MAQRPRKPKRGSKRRGGKGRRRRPQQVKAAKLDLRALVERENQIAIRAGVTIPGLKLTRVGIACTNRIIDSFKGVRNRKLVKQIAAQWMKATNILGMQTNAVPMYAGTYVKFLKSTIAAVDAYEEKINRGLDREATARIQLYKELASLDIATYMEKGDKKILVPSAEIIRVTAAIGFLGRMLSKLLGEQNFKRFNALATEALEHMREVL